MAVKSFNRATEKVESNGNGHAIANAERAVASNNVPVTTSNMPVGLSICQQALWLAAKGGKSKPSISYKGAKPDAQGFAAAPSLSIRAPGKFTAPELVIVCQTQAKKSVGGISVKEAEAESGSGWVHGEKSVSGEDMAASLKLLHDNGIIR